MSRWRRPPTKYDEDEEANADGYFIFNLLDRDQNAYLDIQEIVRARKIILGVLAGDSMLTDSIEGILKCQDENNDGKVIEEEWHDFLRSIYEIAGKKRWQAIMRSFRKSVLASMEEEAGQKGQQSSQLKKPNYSKVAKELNLTEVRAATKIQARVRGNQARKQVAKRKKTQAKIRDVEQVTDAKNAGRHFIKVISGDAEHGARADFYLDGMEIDFNQTHGDFGRGLQVVVINPDTCEVVARNVYDIVKPNVKSECNRLEKDIAEVPKGHFVLAANKGYGLKDLNTSAVAALRSVGATFDGLGRREESYALIGCKGCLASAEQTEKGTAEAKASVSFDQEERARQIVGNMPRDLAP